MMHVIELPLADTSEKTRDEFMEVLRTLAHKLSQPLTCLRGAAEVALMGEIKESECREVLEQSLEETQRIAETLELLRDVVETEGSEERVQAVNWKWSIKKLLQDTASSDENCSLHFFCSVMDEVWVKASGPSLDIATRRLLGWANKRGRKASVRILLSVGEETACLSVCEDGLSPKANPAEKTRAMHPSAVTLEPEDPEWWMIRRAVERQGGWLKNISMPGGGCCYQLYLPLAFSEVTRHS